MQISDKYGLVYVITKLGLLFVYDLETATAVYRNRISPDPIFLTAPAPGIGGFYAINRYSAWLTCLHMCLTIQHVLHRLFAAIAVAHVGYVLNMKLYGHSNAAHLCGQLSQACQWQH